MIDLVVNFVDESTPIGEIPATLLEVGGLDDPLQEDGIEVKGVIGTP
jgi:hypothetical protein